jgi:hypothetical protein
MKHLLFILLVFISVQGFSQSIKINYCDSLEVMKTDLGYMNWDEAKTACENLGDGWRLPTKAELVFMYENRNKIGGFENIFYWSSTEVDTINASGFAFLSAGESYSFNLNKNDSSYVRAVRNLK